MLKVSALIGAVVVGLLSLTAAFAQTGPYGGESLPAGVLGANIGGSDIGLSTSPTLKTNQFNICGKLAQGGGTVAVSFETGESFAAQVAADGSFCVKPPSAPASGSHVLFFNGKQVGQFSVAAAPGAPATGAGSASGSSIPQQAFVALAGVIFLLLGSGVLFARRRS